MNKKEQNKIDTAYKTRLRKAAKIRVKKVSVDAVKAELEAQRDCGKLVGKGAQSRLIDKCVACGMSLDTTAELLTEILGYERNALARVLGHKTSKANTDSRMRSRNAR